MEMMKKHTNEELLLSLKAEIAKSSNELNCAMGDLNKIKTRMVLLNLLIQELLDRKA